MKKFYMFPANVTSIVKQLFKLTLLLLLMSGLQVIAQDFRPPVITSPLMVNNQVTLNAGDMLNITIPNTEPGQVYRIQRTFPVDKSFMEIKSLGGTLTLSPIMMQHQGSFIITIKGLGDNNFVYSFKVDVVSGNTGTGIPEVGNLFPENDGPMSGETLTIVPAPSGNDVTICLGGTVTVSVNNTISGDRYRFRQTWPSGGPAAQEITSGGGTITYNPVSPTVQPYSIWTVDNRDGDFAESFNIYVVNDPIAPVMSKNPNQTSVCEGTTVSATISSNGSGGVSGCADVYEYRTKSGGVWSSWATYDAVTPLEISTTGKTDVEIRASRSHSSGLGCYAENVYSWVIYPLPNPSITGDASVCAGSVKTYTTESSMTGYSWSVTGGSGSSSTNSISVTWGAAGSGQVSVNYTDGNGCTASSPTLLGVTITGNPSVSGAELQSSLDLSTWQDLGGTLSGGYSMYLYPCAEFSYIDIKTFTSSPDILADNLNPFYLNTSSLPSGWSAYWTAKGVVSGASGWQGVMYQIITGSQPIFYVYKTTGGDYQLIDGLQYQIGSGMQPLRISGDYPLWTYTYDGTLNSSTICSSPLTITMTFSRGVLDYTQNKVYGSIQAAVNAASAGDVIKICSGLYIESNITVNKSLIIEGLSKTGVILAPAAVNNSLNSSFPTGYQYAFLIGSSDVTIKNLTIDGEANTALGPGHNYHGGVMTDHRLGILFILRLNRFANN